MAIICAVAFASYVAINCDVGKTEYTQGVIDYLPRYLDWIITTPLLLLTLLLKTGIRDLESILFFVFLDIMMIYTGILATLSTDFQEKGILFGVSSFFYLMIFYCLLQTKVPRFQFYFLFLTWLMYPIVWILHESNCILSNDNYDYVISAMDIFSKIGYGLILNL
jgi:bacteriorhodopsin